MTRKPKPLYPLFVLLVVIALGMSNSWYMVQNATTMHVYQFGSLTSDFEYHCVPAKGRNIEHMMDDMQRYDKKNGTTTVLCRKFSKNYWQFWKWYDNLVHKNPYYDFPRCDG